MMLSESDLYNSNTEPNNNVNPKSLGAMWINYSNGRHYICSNNTMNNNTWLDPIGILANELNSNINNLTNDTNKRINTINSNIENLTNDTNNRINSNQSNINVTNRRIDNLNIENNNKINGINRKINEINTRIDSTIGYNQKWYNNLNRRADVWYQNDTSSPIAIMLTFEIVVSSGGDNFYLFLDIGEPNSNPRASYTIIRAAKYSGIIVNGSQRYYENMFCIVPPTFHYRVTASNISLSYWTELR